MHLADIIFEQAETPVVASVLQGLGSSAADDESVEAAGGCRALQGASETTESPTILSFGRQGFALSSTPTFGVSSAEKHGRHEAVPAGLAHDFGVIPLGGPGVFDGGTFPNIFAVIAARSRKLTRGNGGPACAASHAAGSTHLSTVVVVVTVSSYGVLRREIGRGCLNRESEREDENTTMLRITMRFFGCVWLSVPMNKVVDLDATWSTNRVRDLVEKHFLQEGVAVSRSTES